MKLLLATLLFGFGLTISATQADASDWSCERWANTNKHYLYCGGAFIGEYQGAIACIKGRKKICD